MRIIFLGSPAFAVHPLEALVAAGHEIAAVVTQPDRPAGRRRTLSSPPVKQAADRLGLPVIQPETLRDQHVIDQLAALRPDLGVVAAYGEILRKKVLAIPPLGYLNVHPSLLPLHRGPTPVAGAILAGDQETGVSVMRLDPGMDSGPLLAQAVVPLAPDARAGALTDGLFRMGARMLVEVLEPYASGVLVPHEQDHQQATYTRLLTKGDGNVDWSLPAIVIERMIRAYDPWPTTFTTWHGHVVRIIAARVVGRDPDAALPGTFLGAGESGGPLVATGGGVLELRELQPAGGRVMSGDGWLRGRHDAEGRFGV